MKTISEQVEAQIIEKKSKFISELCYVNSQEEAEQKLAQIRKKYYDAKHHCFAYRICQESGILEKASDDGEPSRNSRSTNVKFVTKTEAE